MSSTETVKLKVIFGVLSSETSLARSDGDREEVLPKSPHQPHSQRFPRTMTGLPQCGHRIVAIHKPPFFTTIVTVISRRGKCGADRRKRNLP